MIPQIQCCDILYVAPHAINTKFHTDSQVSHSRVVHVKHKPLSVLRPTVTMRKLAGKVIRACEWLKESMQDMKKVADRRQKKKTERKVDITNCIRKDFTMQEGNRFIGWCLQQWLKV